MRKNIGISGIIIFAMMMTLQVYGNNFRVNVAESNIKWTGKKVTGSHNGPISLREGTIKVDDGKISGGKFEMDMESIGNNDLTGSMKERLIGHLKSDDFFSVAAHPVSTLVLSSVEEVSGNNYKFTGQLSIKGITHSVEFKGNVSVNEGKLVAAGSILVDRTLYNIRYGSGKFFGDLGDRMIDDNFSLEFKVVASPE